MKPDMPTQLLTDREHAALKVIELAKALALADNHFLSAAVGRLRIVCMPLLMPMATNGTELAIDPQRICDGFLREREAPKHDLMHSVMHCVFLHPFVGASIDRRLWDLACDIAVERVVSEICGPRSGKRGAEIQRALSKVDSKLGERASAEKVYKALKGGEWNRETPSWEVLFAADSHLPWYLSVEDVEESVTAGSGTGDSDDDTGDGAAHGVAQEVGVSAANSSGDGGDTEDGQSDN